MVYCLKINNDSSVVFRLRLTLGFIVFMLCASYLVGGYLLNDLRKSQQNAIENSVPALTQAHDFESELVSISDLMFRLRNVSNAYEAIEVRVGLISHKNRLRDIIDTSLITSGVDDLQNSVRSLGASARRVVSAKLNIISLNKSISAKLIRLREIRAEFNNMLEPLLRAEEAALTQSLESNGLTGKYNSRNQLLEISYSLSTLLDTIQSVSASRHDQNPKDSLVNVKFQLNTIGQRLSDVSDVDTRVNLATMIKQLRALTLGDLGLLESIADYEDYETLFIKSRLVTLNQINTVSARIGEIVLNTEQDVQATTAKFNKTLTHIVISLGLFGCGVLGSIVLVNYIVVERQINRRMRRLAAAVTDIADGRHEREVDVSGKDEIGTMANALEIFKDNAIELERSNKELEQFAYAASHDLKSPLRAIESLAQWTLEDAGDDLPAESKTNLELLLLRANRLSRLQSDLLDYSKVGQPDDSIKEVDFSRMIDDLAEMLDPNHHFTIRVVRAPVGLNTQVVPLRQILLNLITNAIKHHDLESGNIEIAVDAEGNRLRIFVSDDGPGIAADYHERIFGLFEKLESRDKVEGSGLGLSMVKKMVERSKGSIAVVSEPTKNRGTTFVFDWPIAESFSEPEKLVVGF